MESFILKSRSPKKSSFSKKYTVSISKNRLHIKLKRPFPVRTFQMEFFGSINETVSGVEIEGCFDINKEVRRTSIFGNVVCLISFIIPLVDSLILKEFFFILISFGSCVIFLICNFLIRIFIKSSASTKDEIILFLNNFDVDC